MHTHNALSLKTRSLFSLINPDLLSIRFINIPQHSLILSKSTVYMLKIQSQSLPLPLCLNLDNVESGE